MGANFANFFGEPPDAWYMMGVAAGKMTKSTSWASWPPSRSAGH